MITYAKTLWHMTVCSYHVTYAFQSEFTLYSCLNLKELLAQSRREIWSLSDCWVFVYELSGSGYESSCSHLRYPTSKGIKNAITWKSVFKRKSTFLSKIDLSEAITWLLDNLPNPCRCDFKLCYYLHFLKKWNMFKLLYITNNSSQTQ